MVETWHTDKQAIVHKYNHMDSLNERWMMRLKPIPVEYYSIENQKVTVG